MSPTVLGALPTVNALLNGASALLLLTGYLCIRRRGLAVSIPQAEGCLLGGQVPVGLQDAVTVR